MLTRIYLNNFKCFVNFELKLGQKQLIFGENGSGKTSLLEAVLFLRQFVINGNSADDLPFLHQRTRWLQLEQQTFELDATLEGDRYSYRLVVEPWGDPARPRVVSETVSIGGAPAFEFINGDVKLFNDKLESKVTFPFDWHRSALATVQARNDNRRLTRFKTWLSRLVCFRINPLAMGSIAEKEDLFPNVTLANFPCWYRHLVQSRPRENALFLKTLAEVVDGFSYLRSEIAGVNDRLLLVEFDGGNNYSVAFGELSDGQRCLICLYAILHFLLATGGTVILDEPENFVGLRELQPWLMTATDAVEDAKSQLLLISHHPEFLNQWVPGYGLEFVREGAGPVRVKPFDPIDSPLSPAELVARGWQP